MTHRPTRARRAATLAELAFALALVGVLAALTAPRLADALDALRVRGAAHDVAAALDAARHLAIARGAAVTLALDPAAATVTTLVGDSALAERRLGVVHGVTMVATRNAVRYTPVGLGYGASNLRVILRRRRAADTVYVSRLGRVRH